MNTLPKNTPATALLIPLILLVATLPVRAVSFIQIEFLGHLDQTFAPPFFLDIADSLPGVGSARVSVDLALGEVKARLAAVSPAENSSNFVVFARAVDEFTVSGPMPIGTPITIEATLTLTGTVVAPLLDEATPEPGGQSFGSAAIGIGDDSDLFSFTAGINVGTDPFPLSLFANTLIEAQIGVPFDLALFVRMDGANSTSIEAFNTAHLGFNLQPGLVITSNGGFAVPEPSAFVLSSMGILSLIMLRVHCRKP